QLERDRNESGPREVRFTADHEGVRAGVDPPLQAEPERGAGQSHDEDDPGKRGTPDSHRSLEAVNGERRVGIPTREARVTHPLARVVEVRGRCKFGEDSVMGSLRELVEQERHQEAPLGAGSPWTGIAARWFLTPRSGPACQCGLACGSTVLTSDVATIGRNRTNRQNIVKKSPKLPSRHDTSQTVGVKYPQEDGRKSRCSDVTMMTNRSNHMPMLMTIDSANRMGMLVRAFLDQKTCGLITLQLIMIQYAHAYGPSARFMNVKNSYGLPLYQDVKNSVA